NMRNMKEIETTTSSLSPTPAPGAERYPALDFANSAVTSPGDQVLDLLATPATASQWLIEHGLATADLELQETSAAQLRSLREHIRSLIASRIDGYPAPPEGIAAVNEALSRTPAVSLLHWEPSRGLYRAATHPTAQIIDYACAVLATDAA